jgi:phage-related protein
MKKLILLHILAEKDYDGLPKVVKKDLDSLILELAEEGELRMPDAKKLKGTTLFELRVKREGYWRALYAYTTFNRIVILTIFNKKSGKTPANELSKAMRRLLDFLNHE